MGGRKRKEKKVVSLGFDITTLTLNFKAYYKGPKFLIILRLFIVNYISI